MGGNINAQTGLALARSMFLFGTGNGGVPLADKARLLEVSTVDRKTLGKHLLIWEKEREQIAREAAENPFGLCLREEVIESHKADVEWLRGQTDSIKDEVDNVDSIQSDLTKLLRGIKDNLMLEASDLSVMLDLLEKYFTHSLNRQKLLGIFLALQKRWQEASGMSSAISAGETQMKEQAKQRAKTDGERARGESPSQSGGGQAARDNTGVFRRGGQAPT